MKYNYELIKDYLDGILDSETSQQIGKLIREDEIARDMAKGILMLEEKFDNDENIEKYLKSRQESQQKLITANAPSNAFPWLKVAAAVLVIAICGVTGYKLSQPNLSEIINDELAVPYQAGTFLRNSGSDNLGAAMLAYSNGNYQKSIDLLKDIDEPNAIFFLGLSQLYMKKYEEAARTLTNDKIKDSRFEQQSHWFLALAQLQLKNKKAARIALKQMTARRGSFKQIQAEQLLDKL